MLLCHKVVYVYLFKQNMEKVLKIYGKSCKNMGGLYIGHLYWIIQRNTGRKNGIKARCLNILHAVFVQKVHANQFSCIT